MKIGKAGNGSKIHIVEEFTRPSDGAYIVYIACGAQQFNGSGNGSLNRLADFNEALVTCRRCLKVLAERGPSEDPMGQTSADGVPQRWP